MERTIRTCLILALCLGTAATGCSQAHMVVPPDVAKNTEQINITDRSAFKGALADEDFKMGPYEVAEVDRDWSHGSSISALGFSKGSTKGGYAFQLKTKAGVLRGECATEAKDTGFSLGGGVSFSNQVAKLGCTCSGDDGSSSVVISAQTAENYAGELKTRASSYAIEAIYEREGGLSGSDPTGYRVDGDGPAGAVEVIGDGRIWLHRDLDEEERTDMACLFAGLLLYMPPKDD